MINCLFNTQCLQVRPVCTKAPLNIKVHKVNLKCSSFKGSKLRTTIIKRNVKSDK